MDEWRAALLVSDLDVREENFDRLIADARANAATRNALTEWAAEREGELAWTSRMALRELNRTWDPFVIPRLPLDRSPLGLWSPFEDLDAFRTWNILRDVEDELQVSLPLNGVPVDAAARYESFLLEVGKDGVSVEVRERIDGEEEVRTYKAESLEQLLKDHPQLHDRIGYGDALHRRTRDRFSGLMERMRRGFGERFDLDRLRQKSIPTDRLGILMREADQYSSSVEGLEPDVGLLVERVFPQTIAFEMGVRRGDVLVELNGKPLRSGADVQRVLKERAKQEPIDLRIIDASGRSTVLTWKP